MTCPSPGCRLFVVAVSLGALGLLPSPLTAQDSGPEKATIHAYRADKTVATEPTYFCALTGDESVIAGFRKELIRGGARNVILVMPDGVISCDYPVAGHGRPVPPDFVRVRTAESTRAPERFRRTLGTFDEARRLMRERAIPSGMRPDSRPADVQLLSIPLEVERALQERALSPAASSTPCDNRNIYQNSEILSGDILIQVVIPESEPPYYLPESWNEGELFLVRAGLTAAVMDLQLQFSNVPISVVFSYHMKVPTRFEPNTFDSRRHRTWVEDVMSRVRNCPDSWRAEECVHVFNNENRCKWDTDWAFTAFIIDASFVNGYTDGDYRAFGFLGGPYFVLSLPAIASGSGVDRYTYFSKYAERLILHMFWALVENTYREDSKCDERSGYLDWENGNVTYKSDIGFLLRCNPYQDCLMHSNVFLTDPPAVCEWTLGHIGLVDVNENGVPDVFDTVPRIEFAVEGPETTDAATFSIRWRGVSDAVPNRNSRQMTAKLRNYAAPLAEGDAVLASLGRQLPLNSVPDDGEWDSAKEEVTTRVPLFKGYNSVSVQAISSVGARSVIRIKEVYRAGINYQHFEVEPVVAGNLVTWSTRGVRFGARFDIFRWRDDGARERIGTVVSPYKNEHGFDHFRFTDSAVDRGVRYTYSVIAVFDATIAGVEKHFEEATSPASAVARVWLPSGELAHAGPNPFRDRLAVTVSVPAKSVGTAQAPGVDVGTRVDIDVYDVSGRLVARLYHGTEKTGLKTVSWDGSNRDGHQVVPGMYFLKIRVGNRRAVEKILRIR